MLVWSFYLMKTVILSLEQKGKEYAIAHIVFELGNIVEIFKGEK